MLLITKLNAYVFRLKALKLTNNYHGNQRTKPNNLIVPGSRSFLESFSVQFNAFFVEHISQWWIFLFSQFLLLFFSWMILILLVILMTIPFTKHAKTLMFLPKLCESERKSYLNGLRISNDRSSQKCFLVNFVEFLRTPFLTEYLWVTTSG